MYKSYRPQDPHYKRFGGNSTVSLYHIAAILNPPSNFSHKGTQRKKEYTNHTNEKLLEVQKPFLEKVFGRRRQKLTVDSDQYP
jgi:hypothetical protein